MSGNFCRAAHAQKSTVVSNEIFQLSSIDFDSPIYVVHVWIKRLQHLIDVRPFRFCSNKHYLKLLHTNPSKSEIIFLVTNDNSVKKSAV
jgi:hypothetical protein